MTLKITKVAILDEEEIKAVKELIGEHSEDSMRNEHKLTRKQIKILVKIFNQE